MARIFVEQAEGRQPGTISLLPKDRHLPPRSMGSWVAELLNHRGITMGKRFRKRIWKSSIIKHHHFRWVKVIYGLSALGYLQSNYPRYLQWSVFNSPGWFTRDDIWWIIMAENQHSKHVIIALVHSLMNENHDIQQAGYCQSQLS